MEDPFWKEAYQGPFNQKRNNPIRGVPFSHTRIRIYSIKMMDDFESYWVASFGT